MMILPSHNDRYEMPTFRDIFLKNFESVRLKFSYVEKASIIRSRWHFLIYYIIIKINDIKYILCYNYKYYNL